MVSRSCTTLAILMVAGSTALADFPAQITSTIGSKQETMVLTGTAVRKKYFFSIYKIASYVKKGERFRSPEELAARDCPKQLHLVMLRSVSGSQMASAFKEAIYLNYQSTAYQHEVAVLSDFLKNIDLSAGKHVWLTHVPGVGIDIAIEGQKTLRIESLGFAEAIWEIYFGKNNIGESIKRGLSSRL